MGLWRWFRRRSLWIRIPLGILAVLLLLTAVYTAVRAIQYGRCSSLDVRRFVPADAHLSITIDNPEGNWRRLLATRMVSDIRRALRQDKDLREFVSSTFVSMGLPTIDNLEDERYLRQNMEYLTEANVFRLFGDGAAAAVRWNEGASSQFCVAGKLGFGDFWLAPLAELAAPIFLEKSEGGCLVVRTPQRTIYAMRRDSIVAVGDNEAMVLGALRGESGLPKEKETVVHARADFQGCPSLKASTLSFMKAYSVETGLYMLDLEECSTLDAQIFFDADKVTVDVTARGAAARGARHDDHDLHRLAPTDASAVHYFFGGVWELWGRAKEAALDKRSTGFVKDLSAEFVAQLSRRQVESVLFRHLGEAGSLVIGSFDAEEGQTWPAVAMTFDAADPAKAMAALDEMAEGMAAELSASLGSPVRLVREDYGPCVIRAVDRSGPFPLREIRDICYSEVAGHLVIATSRRFLKKIIDIPDASGGKHDCPEEGPPVYRIDARRLATSLDDLVPRAADYTVDTDAMRRAVRRRVVETLRKRMRESDREFEPEVRRLFEEEMNRERAKAASENRRLLGIMGAFGRHTIDIRPEEGAVRLLWTITGLCVKGASRKSR